MLSYAELDALTENRPGPKDLIIRSLAKQVLDKARRKLDAGSEFENESSAKEVSLEAIASSDDPFGEKVFREDDVAEDPFDMTHDEVLTDLYRSDIEAADPFMGQTFQPFGEDVFDGRVLRGDFNKAKKLLKPGFDTYAKYGYPEMNTDAFGQNLVNSIRRLVRGAQL